MPTEIEEIFDTAGLVGPSIEPCSECPFGMVLATGDWNGDGLDDIAVGMPIGGGERGSVALRFGAPLGFGQPTRAPADLSFVAIGQDPVFSHADGDRLGLALAAVDLATEAAGSGFDDLAIAATGKDFGEPDTGVVLITRPEPDVAGGPMSGVYRGAIPGGRGWVRAYIFHDDAEDEVNMRVWVDQGEFPIRIEDCGGIDEAVDEVIPEGLDLTQTAGLAVDGVEAGGDLVREAVATFSDVNPCTEEPGETVIRLVILVHANLEFSGPPTDPYRDLEIKFESVALQATDPDTYEHLEECGGGTITCGSFALGSGDNALELERVDEMW